METLCINSLDRLSEMDEYQLLESLGKEERIRLNMELTCVGYKRKEVIYKEGSRLPGVYLVKSGIIKYTKSGILGRDHIIRFARKGDLLGYRSWFSREPSCSTTEVVQDATFFYIPGPVLQNLLQNNWKLTHDLLKLACRELDESNGFLADLSLKRVREHFAEVLLLLDANFGSSEDQFIRIHLSRSELAGFSGTAPENIIRLLTEFKRSKLIEVKGRRIKILDACGLRKIADHTKP